MLGRRSDPVCCKDFIPQGPNLLPLTPKKQRGPPNEKGRTSNPALTLLQSSTPERIRTSDPRIRSPILYPAELRALDKLS
jgi:hypothetical protein